MSTILSSLHNENAKSFLHYEINVCGDRPLFLTRHGLSPIVFFTYWILNAASDDSRTSCFIGRRQRLTQITLIQKPWSNYRFKIEAMHLLVLSMLHWLGPQVRPVRFATNVLGYRSFVLFLIQEIGQYHRLLAGHPVSIGVKGIDIDNVDSNVTNLTIIILTIPK